MSNLFYNNAYNLKNIVEDVIEKICAVLPEENKPGEVVNRGFAWHLLIKFCEFLYIENIMTKENFRIQVNEFLKDIICIDIIYSEEDFNSLNVKTGEKIKKATNSRSVERARAINEYLHAHLESEGTLYRLSKPQSAGTTTLLNDDQKEERMAEALTKGEEPTPDNMVDLFSNADLRSKMIEDLSSEGAYLQLMKAMITTKKATGMIPGNLEEIAPILYKQIKEICDVTKIPLVTDNQCKLVMPAIYTGCFTEESSTRVLDAIGARDRAQDLLSHLLYVRRSVNAVCISDYRKNSVASSLVAKVFNTIDMQLYLRHVENLTQEDIGKVLKDSKPQRAMLKSTFEHVFGDHGGRFLDFLEFLHKSLAGALFSKKEEPLNKTKIASIKARLDKYTCSGPELFVIICGTQSATRWRKHDSALMKQWRASNRNAPIARCDVENDKRFEWSKDTYPRPARPIIVDGVFTPLEENVKSQFNIQLTKIENTMKSSLNCGRDEALAAWRSRVNIYKERVGARIKAWNSFLSLRRDSIRDALHADKLEAWNRVSNQPIPYEAKGKFTRIEWVAKANKLNSDNKETYEATSLKILNETFSRSIPSIKDFFIDDGVFNALFNYDVVMQDIPSQ